MPQGKPAGVACVQLAADLRCALFGDPRRPQVCRNLRPEPAMCGENRNQALAYLTILETGTST